MTPIQAPVPTLQVHGLSKSYGAQRALDNVTFDIFPGRIVGLLGPNGSGKTTMIKILNGLISDYEGRAVICGDTPGVDTKRRVSYLPDRECLPDWLRVRDVLKMYADFFPDFDTAHAHEMLTALQVDENKRVKALSKGMKEKLQLSLTLARRARLYIFDEPIAGVDPASRELIMQTILKNFTEGSSILLSTHLISDVEPVFDEIIFLKEGQVVLAGNAEDIRVREGKSIDRLFREVFRC